MSCESVEISLVDCTPLDLPDGECFDTVELSLCLVSSSAVGGSLIVRDIDGDPSITATVIEFTNGTVSDQGSGVARVTGLQGPQGIQGIQGIQGDPGSKWYSGVGLPGAGIGSVGDYYLNVGNGGVFEKTGELTWTLVASILGPTGATGAGVAPGGTTGQFLSKGSNTDYDTVWSDLPADQRRFEFTFDYDGTALDDGDTTKVNAVHFDGNILSWILLESDASTPVEIDVWKASEGLVPTSLDSIVNSNYPSGLVQDSGNTSGWASTSFVSGDVIVASLNSSGGATYVKFALIVEAV